MADKALTRSGKPDDVYLLAEGLVDGKVVATHKVQPARRPEKIVLWPILSAVNSLKPMAPTL